MEAVFRAVSEVPFSERVVADPPVGSHRKGGSNYIEPVHNRATTSFLDCPAASVTRLSSIG